ncbi:hypothetical protein VCSRO82_2558 [Vibrio cholerae]|uniref:EpsG family protein n=1 Tax=Vibrio cholerae TaxID=666 RepID=UPI0011D4AC4A|nr:EpsG family protein [Vibrio cholerae]TXZ35578.1 hypothetical protein FXE69_03900 [Vibrio cholerae]BCN21628.1 putative O-antigen polymerase [Vibrio cholerae]GHZ88175.1 hypothetical protein VCSRO82_2558 [Vibrio cholerae]
MSINISNSVSLDRQRVDIVVTIALVFGFLILPGPAYIAMLTLCIVIFPSMKSHLIAFITIFYFSFLIASRYSGLIWFGSDDLPSYFLAYDAITSGERDSISASFFYAKHLDIGFIGLTKIINYLTGGNRFLYYFTLVSTSFSIYYYFLYRVLKGGYALLALILFFLYFKNIHLSMHILRSSLAIPIILLSLSFSSSKRYFVFLIAGTFQASSSVLASFSLLTRDMMKKLSFKQKGIIFSLFLIVFFFIGHFYLFGKVTNVKLSPGFGNYPVVLANIIVGMVFIIVSNKNFLRREDGTRWLYIYGYFIFVSSLSLLFTLHTYRFSHFVLYITPLMIAFSISSGKKFDYLLYVLVLVYISGLYYTYYYILNLNESGFYYRSSSDVLINGFSQIFLFFDYVKLDVDYSSFWRIKDE